MIPPVALKITRPRTKGGFDFKPVVKLPFVLEGSHKNVTVSPCKVDNEWPHRHVVSVGPCQIPWQGFEEAVAASTRLYSFGWVRNLAARQVKSGFIWNWGAYGDGSGPGGNYSLSLFVDFISAKKLSDNKHNQLQEWHQDQRFCWLCTFKSFLTGDVNQNNSLLALVTQLCII
jgi:hypothetical protein